MAQNDGKQTKTASVWIFQPWILLEPSQLKTFSRVTATNKTLMVRSGLRSFGNPVLNIYPGSVSDVVTAPCSLQCRW